MHSVVKTGFSRKQSRFLHHLPLAQLLKKDGWPESLLDSLKYARGRNVLRAHFLYYMQLMNPTDNQAKESIQVAICDFPTVA